MDFVKYKLYQLLKIKNGRDHKKLSKGNYPVYGSGGLMRYVDSYLYDKASILLPRKGTLSNIQLVYGTPFWTVDTTYYTIINEKIVNYYYLWLYLKSLDLSGYDSGASIPSMTTKTYNSLTVFLPERSIQDIISNIIFSYDNYIENNNERIKLLEQMAENIYKEWFVRFRFPGYKNAEFGNGIPFGWNYTTLDKIVSFDRGISYSSEEIECDDGVNLINLKNIQSYGGFRREGTKKYNGKYKESQVVKRGDLILGVTDMTQDRRTVGHVAMIPTMKDVCVISADLVRVNSKISKVFLYSMFRYGFYSKYFSQFANGANVLHLKPGVLMNKKILMPSKELIDEFSKKVSPMMEMIDKLNLINDNLIKQRDYLLPRLMSGKLEV